ncbi:PPC domain-containing protein [Verrucomicrobium spinosum]|uniref:PPC domain-containing protein n=1 Tax=Verrucomicrobium spinosum TaxID=2736 RepID=UPI0012E20ED3|nr:PPC domain-containing protein [Verrucomicrobium spinosum]
MKNSLRLVGVALVLATSAPAVVAALPTFTGTSPTGVQRGVETTLTIRGSRLADFDGLIFYSPGFALKSVGKVENGSVETVITVAPDVPLGNHFVRVRTRSGVSFMRQIMVGPFASVQEKEPNNEFEAPQDIALNQTVEGVANTEDVDYYRIAAKKGQRISLEIEAMRLGYITFDPFIALVNSDRFEVAVSDDTVLHRQDGHLTFVAPEDGNYTIQVRESSYRGNGDSRYRLHVGSFRRPEVCYPSGGKAGSTQKVKFIEANGDVTEEDVTLPAESSDKHMVYLKDDPAPSGNIMRVSPFDSYLEVEPNDKEANRTNLEAPCALNGIIEKPGDEDRFWVNLKKGMKVDFFAYAQSLGSPLDPVLVLTNEKGNQIGAADDGGTKRRLDCKLSVTAPADGAYCVIIRDHLQRGGPTYVYRVEAVASVPLVTFASPNFGVNDSHKRQFIAVPRGNRYATMVNVTRNNASGDMTFEAPNLPPGVKLVSTNMPGNQTSIPLLFEATADAPLGGAAVPVTLKPTDPAQKVEGRMAQEFDMVRSGNTIYYTEQVDQLPVAVVEEVPYTLDLIKPTTPLVPNGLLSLKVVAKRKEGFKAAIRVLMLWRPNGINSQGEIDIPEGQDEGTFTLDSTGNVSPGTYNLTVLGEAEGGNGTIYAASPFCEVTVVPAYLSGSMQLTAVEQGKEGEFLCKLEHALPFDGEASAKIYGIPDSVEVETLKFNKDAKELTFKIKTTDKSPVGKHANLFCQVDVPVQGGVAVHRIAGGTTLRVDAPRKAPAAPAQPAAQVAAAKPATPAATDAPKKQLSRLEQLRQEAAAK